MEELFVSLATESRELYVPSFVQRIEVPEPVEFLRDYVLMNKPVVIKNAFDDWAALSCWSSSYLREKIGEKLVTVDFTPDGKGDCVYKNRFVMPEERKMKFGEFLDRLENPAEYYGVPYVQHQNSSFVDEYSDLWSDAALEINWMNAAMGAGPDAVNFWMGDERAVSSLHHDPYENLYCVVRGKKIFTLFPPCDAPFLYKKKYKSARFLLHDETQTFDVIDSEPESFTPWVSVDPEDPDYYACPHFQHASSLTVRVEPGEMLYLPAMWFHMVEQENDTVAVNYWYDQLYGPRWAYYQFLEKVMDKSELC